MKSSTPQGSVKIWYGLLKLAISQGLEIDRSFYKNWGTKKEISSLSFHRWWNSIGRDLFEKSQPVARIQSSTSEAILVRIPLGLSAKEAAAQVSALVTKHRGSKRVQRSQPLAFTGDVNYKRLKQYERYLGIEFDPRYAGKTVEEKTEALRDEYRKIKVRLLKQRDTLRTAGKGQIARKLNFRDPDKFDSEAALRKGVNPKKVSRWRLSGKHLLLNVAEGQFPGRGYYGDNLAKKLADRLAKRGISDIGQVVRNKGGGRTKAQLRLLEARQDPKVAAAMSLKAYGAGKDALPTGDTGGVGWSSDRSGRRSKGVP